MKRIVFSLALVALLVLLLGVALALAQETATNDLRDAQAALDSTAIGGGQYNEATAMFATVAGGGSNVVTATYATVGGGRYNDATADYAAVGGGYNNDASGDYATIGGGEDNTVAGENATVSGGVENTASGRWGAVGGGAANYATDFATTVGGGQANQATEALATVPGGGFAKASLYGQMAYASGRFYYFGDAQAGLYVLRNSTSSTIAKELFLDGESERLVLENNRTLTFDLLVVARTSNGESAGYSVQGVIENYAGSTNFIGAPSVTALGEDRDWNVVVEADDTNDALVIRVTGEAGYTIRWVATVRTVEVLY